MQILYGIYFILATLILSLSALNCPSSSAGDLLKTHQVEDGNTTCYYAQAPYAVCTYAANNNLQDAKEAGVVCPKSHATDSSSPEWQNYTVDMQNLAYKTTTTGGVYTPPDIYQYVVSNDVTMCEYLPNGTAHAWNDKEKCPEKIK